jgi:hypothetical protein
MRDQQERLLPPCSCDDIEDGEWVTVNREEHYDGFWCPLWNNTILLANYEERFNCAARSKSPPPFRQFVPRRRGCSVEHGAGALSTLHDNRTAYFIGDSVTRQHAKAYACRLLHDWCWQRARGTRRPREVCGPAQMGMALNLAPWISLVHPPPAASIRGYTQAYAVEQNSLHYINLPPWCISVATRSVCWLGSWPTAHFVAEQLARHRLLSAGDLLVLNDGLHFAKSTAMRAARDLTDAVANRSSPLARAQAHGVRLVWRETSPQAFPFLPNGSFLIGEAVAAHRVLACTPVNETARPAHHVAMHKWFARAGVPVVPTWLTTVTQWDSHLSRHTPYYHHKGDCTHFCEPIGALEEWVNALLSVVGPTGSWLGREACANVSHGA